jgi:hypothetical protein
MPLAVALARQPRIVGLPFLCRFAAEIGQPGLNVPSGNEEGDPLVLAAVKKREILAVKARF